MGDGSDAWPDDDGEAYPAVRRSSPTGRCSSGTARVSLANRRSGAGLDALCQPARRPPGARWETIPRRQLRLHEGAYLNHIAVDSKTGMIELMFEWRRTPDPSTTNDVGYAQSPDGGRTWQTATGEPLCASDHS